MKDSTVKIVIPYLTNLNLETSTEDAIRLLDLIKNTDIKNSTCIKSFFNGELAISTHNSVSTASIHSELKLLGLANMQKTICQPAQGKLAYTQSKHDMLKRCLNNLKCGKCQDEYVRRTVGAVLFPQHYAKQK